MQHFTELSRSGILDLRGWESSWAATIQRNEENTNLWFEEIQAKGKMTVLAFGILRFQALDASCHQSRTEASFFGPFKWGPIERRGDSACFCCYWSFILVWCSLMQSVYACFLLIFLVLLSLWILPLNSWPLCLSPGRWQSTEACAAKG